MKNLRICFNKFFEFQPRPFYVSKDYLFLPRLVELTLNQWFFPARPEHLI